MSKFYCCSFHLAKLDRKSDEIIDPGVWRWCVGAKVEPITTEEDDTAGLSSN